jgi:ADP-ribose pyrophosphatase YjhB (NUDIX family)
LEETGLHVAALRLATVFERIMPCEAAADPAKPEYHYVLVDFYCKVLGGDLQAGDDSRRAEWFELNALADLPMTAGTREVIETCCAGRGTLPNVTRP